MTVPHHHTYPSHESEGQRQVVAHYDWLVIGKTRPTFLVIQNKIVFKNENKKRN